METQFLALLATCLFLLCLWAIDRIKTWHKNRLFWKEFEKRIEQQNKEFYDSIFQSLLNSPEFVQAIRNLMEKYNNTPLAKIRDKGLIAGNSTWNKPELTNSRFDRFKQWVINIF